MTSRLTCSNCGAAIPAELLADEWAKGRFPSEIAGELGLTESKVNHIVRDGPEAAKASADHFRNKAAREPRKYQSPESVDREARVLNLWGGGASAGEIGDEFGITRNTVIGIVHRARGEEAEEAKRSHLVLIGHTNAPRPRRLHPKPATTPRLISTKTNAELKRVLSPQELAERRAECMAVQQAAIAKVELRVVSNPAFTKPEPELWLYAHLGPRPI